MKTIKSIEDKETKTGKDYKVVTFEDGSTASVFPWDYSGFNQITVGDDIDEDYIDDDGKYTNIKDPDKQGNSSSGGSQSPQKRKEDSINKAMNKKEKSIRLSSTMRDATLLTQAQFQGKENPDPKKMKDAHQQWRAWLWDNWESINKQSNTPF